MISTDFAPNENCSDARQSLITLMCPWLWQKGNDGETCINLLNSMFPKGKTTLFLSARSALFFLLQSFNLPQNSSVAVVGFTCEAVVLPICANNLIPLYIDIEKDTYSFDYRDLEKKITTTTKVLILQHTFGLVPKYRNEVLQFAKERNIFVIEDLAHGFQPKFWQSQVGSDNQALLLSFGRSKALSSVFGGGLICYDKKLHGKITQLEAKLPHASNLFISKLLFYKPFSLLIINTYNVFYIGKIIHKIINLLRLFVAEISQKEKGGMYDSYLEKKYPNALAKLLLTQLRKYPEVVERRRQVALLYKKYFPLNSSSIPGRFPVIIENRDATLNDVSIKSIYLGNWYSQPVAPVGLNLQKVKYTIGSCPVAESVCKHIVNLPTLINQKDAQQLVELIKNK